MHDVGRLIEHIRKRFPKFEARNVDAEALIQVALGEDEVSTDGIHFAVVNLIKCAVINELARTLRLSDDDLTALVVDTEASVLPLS